MNKNTLNTLTKRYLIGLTLLLVSCVPGVTTTTRKTREAITQVDTNVLAIGQGYVLSDNPIILTGNNNLADNYDLSKLLTNPGTITTKSFLESNYDCAGLTYCFEVRENKDSSSALQTSSGKWGYIVYSPEFLQVNTFYHMNVMSDYYLSNFGAKFSQAIDDLLGIGIKYDTSLPISDSSNISYAIESNRLMAYADCDAKDNAYYDSSDNVLCFGYISNHAKVKWAQDSTVIYHELGHYLQNVNSNLRNFSTVLKSNIGRNGLYSESGSLGEGLSDFYSYYSNNRTHFAEWGAGRFLASSRPIAESDSLHAAGISTNVSERLSYPDFLTYNPNDHEYPIEDVHYAGMIISHYLVALTKDIEEKCSLNHRASSDIVSHLITETLSELGDLTSKGTEKNTSGLSKVNLSSDESKALDWQSKVNPINYRSFSQTIAKNLYNYFYRSPNAVNNCNGNTYSKDNIESLLDQYGLLIFRTYNENRNIANPSVVSYNNTNVTSTNRKKSILISKNLVTFDPAVGAPQAFVIDSQKEIASAVSTLKANGVIKDEVNNRYPSAQTPSDFGFNNGNSRVSPGEIVGIALNLYNNSNATMGGIQVLANDWHHADYTDASHPGKPCQLGNDNTDKWPLTSEGGSTHASCSTAAATVANDFAPVCFVQYSTASSTQWISQKEYKDKVAIDSSLCLNPNDPKDCFIRAVKGMDQSYYSKINPKSTWGKTLADPKTGTAYSLDWSNIIMFEVSKHIPPGSVVDCRLRVRFTNCDDCFHDSTRSYYDFKDIEYNGSKPFKIIHLQFPITD